MPSQPRLADSAPAPQARGGIWLSAAASPYTCFMFKLPLPRVLAVLCVVVFTGLCRGGEDKDAWFTVEMLGQRAGWMHTTTSTKGDRITTSSKMHMTIKRGEATISVSEETEFVETAAGKPVSMKGVQSLSAAPTTTRYTFKEDGSIEMESDVKGQHSKETFAKPEGVWLTPAAADRYFLERFRSGAKEIKLRMIDPTSGPRPVTVTRKDFEKTSITLDGKKLDVTKLTSVTNAGLLIPNVTATEYIDQDGEIVRTDTSFGVWDLKILATTREK